MEREAWTGTHTTAKPLGTSAWFCDIVQVWKKNKSALVRCLFSFVKTFLCFAFGSALHIIATGEIFECNNIPVDIWCLKCPQQIGMVLYGPRLMSSACSWFQGCKQGKAEGRKAIFPPQKSNLLGGPSCTCVNSKFDPELPLSFLHRMMDSLGQWLSEPNLALASVFSWKIFPQLCKVSELFACFPEWSEDCSRWPNA